MCAMALVHSRVRRVVYCHPDPAGGALGGALRLHGRRSLNHHYQARPPCQCLTLPKGMNSGPLYHPAEAKTQRSTTSRLPTSINRQSCTTQPASTPLHKWYQV